MAAWPAGRVGAGLLSGAAPRAEAGRAPHPPHRVHAGTMGKMLPTAPPPHHPPLPPPHRRRRRLPPPLPPPRRRLHLRPPRPHLPAVPLPGPAHILAPLRPLKPRHRVPEPRAQPLAGRRMLSAPAEGPQAQPAAVPARRSKTRSYTGERCPRHRSCPQPTGRPAAWRATARLGAMPGEVALASSCQCVAKFCIKSRPSWL